MMKYSLGGRYGSCFSTVDFGGSAGCHKTARTRELSDTPPSTNGQQTSPGRGVVGERCVQRKQPLQWWPLRPVHLTVVMLTSTAALTIEKMLFAGRLRMVLPSNVMFLINR